MARRLTPKGQDLVSNGKELEPWIGPGQGSPFIFESYFDHKGVSLTAQEVLSIQADKVFANALAWATKWNQDEPTNLFFFAGIDYLGPKDGEWWEEKREEGDLLHKHRVHHFWGTGRSYLLTLKH